MRVVLGGDVMLGRGVAQRMQVRGASWPLGPVSDFMRLADLVIVNLECAITDSLVHWGGAPKAFYFGAPPMATQVLEEAGVSLVTLANNHVLDFDLEGLQDSLRLLDHAGIAHAGAGADLAAALAPAILERGGLRFGVVAYCDHQADFAAGPNEPGIAWIDLNDEVLALEQFETALEAVKRAPVDWPVLSLHWGPNMELRPSARFVRLARAAVDMGWRIVFGHSAHVFQGIELYRGCPIIYAAGDLVDDYLVDQELRNDRQCLIELDLERDRLRNILLHPVRIARCRTDWAEGADFDAIAQRARVLCAEMGTKVEVGGCALRIRVEDGGSAAGSASIRDA